MKKLEGNPGKRKLNTKELVPAKGMPACPDWLMPEAKKEWERLAKLMNQMHELKERDTAKKPEEVDYELGYFVCPSCRESICFIDGHAEEHECCLKCGQRLDWSEEYHDGKM